MLEEWRLRVSSTGDDARVEANASTHCSLFLLLDILVEKFADYGSVDFVVQRNET